MTKEEHNCDNVNCNHNNTKGLCCLHNPNNCKYRQLQKENAELKSRECWKSCEYANPKSELIAQHIKDVQQLTKAKDYILKLTTYLEGHTNYDFEYELIKEVKQFLSEVEK